MLKVRIRKRKKRTFPYEGKGFNLSIIHHTPTVETCQFLGKRRTSRRFLENYGFMNWNKSCCAC